MLNVLGLSAAIVSTQNRYECSAMLRNLHLAI
jgi:hypothetical protein